MENSMEILEETMSSGKYTFELYYDGDDTYLYQCRGEMLYDDDHDEMPEPELWDDAEALADVLEDEGYKCSVEHSEKGWVEVHVSIW